MLYLFSDGEQTSSKARRTFSSLRRYLSDAFTVAIGSEQGGNIPVIADGVDGNADQWVTDPDTGKPGVSRMNKDEMASIADELSGTALVLNASNTMRDGVSKEASDKWRVTQTTKKRTRTMPVVWPLAIVTLLLLILQPGMVTIIFALMLTEWVGMSRIARAEMLKLKDQEFVLASRTLGAGSFFIIFKEVLPNIIGPIITQVMFSIPTAIFTEAFLSFVGLGIPVPQCSLGSLISELYNSFTTHPYQIIPPIVVMSLLMLSFNLLADGLREALDPKMKSM